MKNAADDELKVMKYLLELERDSEGWIKVSQDILCKELNMSPATLMGLLFKLEAKRFIVLNRLPKSDDLYDRVIREIMELELKLLTNKLTEEEYLENIKIVEQRLNKIVPRPRNSFRRLPLIETLNLFRQLNRLLNQLGKLIELKDEQLSSGEKKAKDRLKGEINNKIIIICNELEKNLDLILKRIRYLEERREKLQEKIDESKIRSIIGEINEREFIEIVDELNKEKDKMDEIIKALLSISQIDEIPEEIKENLETLETRLLVQEISKEEYEAKKNELLATFSMRKSDLREVNENITQKLAIYERLKTEGVLLDKSYKYLNNLYKKITEKIGNHL